MESHGIQEQRLEDGTLRLDLPRLSPATTLRRRWPQTLLWLVFLILLVAFSVWALVSGEVGERPFLSLLILVCVFLGGAMMVPQLWGRIRVELQGERLELIQRCGHRLQTSSGIALRDVLAVGPRGPVHRPKGLAVYRRGTNARAATVAHEECDPGVWPRLRDRVASWMEERGHDVDPLVQAYLWEEKPPPSALSTDGSIWTSPAIPDETRRKRILLLNGVLLLLFLLFGLSWFVIYSVRSDMISDVQGIYAGSSLPVDGAGLGFLMEAMVAISIMLFLLLVHPLVLTAFCAIFVCILLPVSLGKWSVTKRPDGAVEAELRLWGRAWSRRSFMSGSRPCRKRERLGMESPGGRWRSLAPTLPLEQQAALWAWLREPAQTPTGSE